MIYNTHCFHVGYKNKMIKLFELSGNIAAILGVLICIVSGVSRLMGNWETAGYSTMTFFTLGIGLMVYACLVKLDAISKR